MCVDPSNLRTEDFDYKLPRERIAQFPAAPRDASRLLIYTRAEASLAHRIFSDLPEILLPTDTLVINDSKVIPARLRGRKASSGGNIEILLLKEDSPEHWWVMLKPGKRVRKGMILSIDQKDGMPSAFSFEVLDKNAEGHCLVHFRGAQNFSKSLDALGELPLPPYIDSVNQKKSEIEHCYQTIYAREKGSIAAPTAGLHFSPKLLTSLKSKGIEMIRITLHVGFGTFSPIKVRRLSEHKMHAENFIISVEAARRLNTARSKGRRIIAVGTSTLRVLETAFEKDKCIRAQRSSTELFIRPPHHFGFADALITNFHLPRSTLLMLVSAMIRPGKLDGMAHLRDIYAKAIEEQYRFFSYGDAMLIQ